MSIPVIVLLVMAWLAVGWLPSRILKHWFVVSYGDALGDKAWTVGLETTVAAMSIGGPVTWIAVALIRVSFGTDSPADKWDRAVPWGWMW